MPLLACQAVLARVASKPMLRVSMNDAKHDSTVCNEVAKSESVYPQIARNAHGDIVVNHNKDTSSEIIPLPGVEICVNNSAGNPE